jgi:hypothetical protein
MAIPNKLIGAVGQYTTVEVRTDEEIRIMRNGSILLGIHNQDEAINLASLLIKAVIYDERVEECRRRSFQDL